MKERVKQYTEQAEFLVHALPYIQRYQGKTMVIKYGGNAMIHRDLTAAVMQDVLFMAFAGMRTVLVHGGGPEIEAMLKALGKESRFVQGLRYTDAATMEIVQMVLCGKVNKDISSLIQQQGGRAVGICGIDGGLLQAHLLRAEEDLGLVGEIERVDSSILTVILDSGAIPVVASVARGVGDAEGLSLNINADMAAARIASALKAEKLLLMTDVPGLLRDVSDPASLIPAITCTELSALKKAGIISRGMIPKTDCCTVALEKGAVKQAHIIDGRLPHALLTALFTDEGIGTMIEAG
ncbi:MAG: acetylglutamate kinase [Treponema sp.]|jgi:acetylglutamate kinase|nr:acetylglutamate kinase [Treponema sp.]